MTHFITITLLSALFSPQEAAPGVADAGPQDDGSSAAIRALEERVAAQEKEIAGQKEQIGKLAERLDAAEDEALEEAGDATREFEPSLKIYGFFDVDVIKWFIDEKDPIRAATIDHTSFLIPRIHTYFLSRMTPTLNALIELRFTFLPHGAEENILSYQRTDTTVTDPLNYEELQIGGVVIERAQLTWQPWDFVGVTAGRYLTPFGIWNTDHGSPVLLPMYSPYLMINHTVPLAQTGVEIHGRFFPADGLYIDYALTLSNGRGPTEQVYDLDENKALGLRLRFLYEGKKVTAALGGYGYLGQTTDLVKQVESLDPFVITETDTEVYDELTGSLDFLLELFGIRLQAEYARGRIEYDTRPVRRYPIVDVDSPTGMLAADYIKQDVYGLLAYELPLGSLIGDMKITPWGMVEHSIADDTSPDFTTLIYRWGINFKPNEFVVLKADASCVTFPESEMMTYNSWTVGGQLSVAF